MEQILTAQYISLKSSKNRRLFFKAGMRLFSALIFLTFLSACFSSKKDLTIEQVKLIKENPEYESVLIAGLFDDDNFRDALEQAFEHEMIEQGIDAVPSNRMLLPSKKVRNKKLFKICEQYKLDSILKIKMADVPSAEDPSQLGKARELIGEDTLILELISAKSDIPIWRAHMKIPLKEEEREKADKASGKIYDYPAFSRFVYEKLIGDGILKQIVKQKPIEKKNEAFESFN